MPFARLARGLEEVAGNQIVVDGPLLGDTVTQLAHLARDMPVVFPVHPRTRKMMEALPDWSPSEGLLLTEPFGYLDFLSLETDVRAVLTDSGGIQEETTYLGVPCFTLRANTERPVTITHGTNELLGDRPAALLRVRPSGRPPTPCAIPLWDGHAAERAADALVEGYPAIAAPSRAAPSSSSAGVAVANETRSVLRRGSPS